MRDAGFVYILVDGETSFLVEMLYLSTFGFHYEEFRGKPEGSEGEGKRLGFRLRKRIENIL